MTTDLRDRAGRPFDAPAWNGSLDDLDANQLSERAAALASHIGRITSSYRVLDHRFDVAIDVDEIRRWAVLRIEVLNELERRADSLGVATFDLVRTSESWKSQFRS